jgi:hypothetical protein
MASSDSYVKTYNSFSGVDIKAVFADKVIGTLQAISHSVTREKAPLYCMGSPNPRAFSRGKRGIAGSMIFLVFDRDQLLYAMGDRPYLADKDEARVYQSYNESLFNTQLSITTLDTMSEAQAATTLASTNGTANFDQQVMPAFYADQIPPFDVSLCGANEYGALMVRKIFGVELLNEGSGCSIDDIVIEQQYTYVARELTPWIPQAAVSLK